MIFAYLYLTPLQTKMSKAVKWNTAKRTTNPPQICAHPVTSEFVKEKKVRLSHHAIVNVTWLIVCHQLRLEDG